MPQSENQHVFSITTSQASGNSYHSVPSIFKINYNIIAANLKGYISASYIQIINSAKT